MKTRWKRWWAVAAVIVLSNASADARSLRRNVGTITTYTIQCWNSSGAGIPCAGSGQDGEYQKGWTLPYEYARFLDNGDGTVTDRLTGFIWLKNANCFGQRTWQAALADANALADGACGLTDGSEPGDWRLPNVRELFTLIDFQSLPPAIFPIHPFTGIQLAYWSSTSLPGDQSTSAWWVELFGGIVSNNGKANFNSVWPVRGGE